MSYHVTFWGTRGSVPTPGPATTRYGGNTPCIAIRRPDDSSNHWVILDAGTGMRAFGQWLMHRNGGAISVDLLVSHTHWDHIQGLPYFAPFFTPGTQVRVWGARQDNVDLEAILRELMNPVVFPVPLDQLAADLSVQHVDPGEFVVGGFRVNAMRVRHPGNTLAFVLRPEAGGAALAYVTDNELTGGDYPVGPAWRRDFVEFLRGAEVLVHDAMYTSAELERHRGWGHSSNVEAVRLAVDADVRQLVLFHHRPEHDDGTIDAMLLEAKEAARQLGGSLEVIAAQEGTELTL